MAKECKGWEGKDMPGMGWRVGLSVICFFALISFLVLWLFFYADSYTVYQNMAAVIVSILVFLGVMGAAWASWGMKHGPQMEKRHKRQVPYPSTVPPKKPKKRPSKAPKGRK